MSCVKCTRARKMAEKCREMTTILAARTSSLCNNRESRDIWRVDRVALYVRVCTRAALSLKRCCTIARKCTEIYKQQGLASNFLGISSQSTSFAIRSSCILLFAAREWLFNPPLNAQSALCQVSKSGDGLTEYFLRSLAPPG